MPVPSTLSRRRLLCLFGGAAAAAVLVGCGAAAKDAAPTHPAEGGHDGAARQFWRQSGGDDLLKGKTLQALFDAQPNRMQAFQLADTYLRCIDEGCPGGLHLAGSGCLYDRAHEDLKGKIAGIYTHEGCGAAKLFAEQRKIETDDPDAVADAEAKKLAGKLGVPYLGRIKAADMARPASLHDARVVYYDGTGKFDPTRVAGLPKGFLISRKLIRDPGYAKAEVEVAIGIAMGDHGFGHLFSGATPLYVCCVGGLDKDSVPLEVMAEEMRAVAGKHHNVEIQTLLARPELDPAAKPVVKAADSSKDGADAHGAPAATGHDGGHASFGPTYVIKDRTVNLADPTVRRYLRFSVAIEFAPHEATKASAAPTYAGAWSHLISYTPEYDGYQPVAGGKNDPEKEFQAHVKRYVPAMEDAVMTLLSSKSYAEVATADRRESIKREIKTRLGALLEGTDLHVTGVYFTDFVVQ